MDEKGDSVSSGYPEINQVLLHKCVIGEEVETENLKIKEDMETRIHSLREVMYSLKEQLRDEKELWRKEIDEVYKLQYEENLVREMNFDGTVLSSLESTSITGAADNKHNPLLNETSLTVYEKYLQRYHDALRLLGLQADYRQQMRRQIVAQTYKKKLMEIERMCNIELARVKQTASFLEPLNKIASEWNLPQNETHKNQKFMSLGDLHSASCKTPPHTGDDTENEFQMQSLPAGLHHCSSSGHLSISGCEREHLTNLDDDYTTVPVMFMDKDMNLEQTELNNTFCECDDLPIVMQNSLWPN